MKMQETALTIRLSANLLKRSKRLATQRHMPLSLLIRELLTREIMLNKRP